MIRKYFTIDEVNQLIPQLEHHFRKLLLNKKEMAKLSLRLKKVGVEAPMLENFEPDPRLEVQKIQMEFSQNYLEFKNHLLAVESMGGRIKDLELGRVEFFAKEQDKYSLLTWQLGVTEVAHSEDIPISLLKETSDDSRLSPTEGMAPPPLQSGRFSW